MYGRQLISLVAVFLIAVNSENGASGDIAQEARQVLKTYCYKCHGAEFKVPRFNVLDIGVLTERTDDEDSYVALGSPNDSKVWQRLGLEQDMPPEGQAQPSEQEREVIRKWIAEGAQTAIATERETIPVKAVLSAIASHIQKATLENDSPTKKRYFSIHHLHNNPSVSTADLRLYRAALSKLLNSLSRKRSIVVPETIDDNETVFAIDLEDYGWETKAWKKAIASYAYGVSWLEPDLSTQSQQISTQMGGDFNGADNTPYIRADWFIRTASRPPAYHVLLDLPDTLSELEAKIGVNVIEDFATGSRALQRAGFAGSGVSRHNRVVDRHSGRDMTTDYYYKSYDFGKSSGRGSLSVFPLGPKFDKNPFPEIAFEHDGGEVIYSLPNGLQGYMLSDAEGNRLPGDEAPIKIVRDVNEFAGTPIITNGISCIGCHKRGIIDYKDSIKSNLVFGGIRGKKIDDLYVDHDKLQSLLDDDRARFVRALHKAVGPFLKEGEDYGEATPFERLEDSPEPVSAVARWYDKDLSATDAAAELDLTVNAFIQRVLGNNRIKQLGVAPLGKGARIPRQLWDSTQESGVSVFQRIFTEMGAGAAAPLDP